MVHNHVLAEHPGIEKTIALGVQQFWWPGIKDYLTQYIKGCAVCQSTKPSRNKKAVPLFPITPDCYDFSLFLTSTRDRTDSRTPIDR